MPSLHFKSLFENTNRSLYSPKLYMHSQDHYNLKQFNCRLCKTDRCNYSIRCVKHHTDEIIVYSKCH